METQNIFQGDSLSKSLELWMFQSIFILLHVFLKDIQVNIEEGS